MRTYVVCSPDLILKEREKVLEQYLDSIHTCETMNLPCTASQESPVVVYLVA